jgi:hypothetical protein
MDAIAHLEPDKRAELFAETQRKTRIPAAIVEKDFWVCWVLRYLFTESELKNDVIFKGGTSLSKVFRVIERFSEDIDLILNWRLLGYSNDEPWQERSNTQQDKFNKALNRAADEHIVDTLVPMFSDALCAQTIDGLAVQKDSEEEQLVNIAYPRSFDDAYIRPQVRLEIGPLASWTPHDSYVIKPYAAEQFPELFDKPDCPVKAIRAERTFWEKATILHRNANWPMDKPPLMRFSRHYYDLYRLGGSSIRSSALEEIALLSEVGRFKAKFYRCPWAEYEKATPGTLKLMPAEHGMKSLREDYANMKEMIFGDRPEFDVMLEAIKDLQDEINAAA